MKSHWPSGREKGWSASRGTRIARPHIRVEPVAKITIDAVTLPATLNEGERGALVMPVLNLDPLQNGFTINGGGFDPDATRSTLLLFDRLAHPQNSAFSCGSLEEHVGAVAGVEDSRVQVSGPITPELFSLALGKTFEALDEREPELWTLAKGAQGFTLPADLLGDLTAFKIKLENALPMPDRSVSFEEVLNYRNRRGAELVALRHYVEGLALQVSRDGFGGLVETMAFEQFKQALEDHSKAIRETNWLKRLTSVDVTFNWNTVVAAALLAPIDLGAAAGALSGVLSFDSAVGLKKPSETPRPFEYIFRAGGEM